MWRVTDVSWSTPKHSQVQNRTTNDGPQNLILAASGLSVAVEPHGKRDSGNGWPLYGRPPLEPGRADSQGGPRPCLSSTYLYLDSNTAARGINKGGGSCVQLFFLR